jgi:hypothetical protein
MKRAWLLLLALAGCQDNGGDDSNAAAEAGGGSAAAVATAGLTGLFEGGSGAVKNQLCILDRGAGNARFGLVVWGANQHSCSGSGSVVRDGGRLRLAMAGDSACIIDAAIEGDRITLPATLPEGCAYYCGARARMAGAAFQRSGSSAADAMRATDLVGEPLCGGSAS